MATIKRNGNLIVLKSGKVSCTCCAAICCMYPANGFGTDADLPDTINFNGTTLSKSGSNYGNTNFGVILEGSSWVRYINGEAVSSASCLIKQDLDTSICSAGPVTDNFSSSYYLDSSDGELGPEGCPGGFYSNIITRGKYSEEQGGSYFVQGCCGWGSAYSNCSDDPPEQESGAGIFYNAPTVDILGNGSDLNKWVCGLGVGQYYGVKSGNQNSPVGTYPIYLYFQGSITFAGNVVVS